MQERVAKVEAAMDFIGARVDDHEERMRIIERSNVRLVTIVSIAGAFGSFAGAFLLKLIG